MDSSAISWLSEMGLDNHVFTDQINFMDDELAAVVGVQQDFVSSCLSPEKNPSSSSSPALINIASTNSITSLCTTTFPVVTDSTVEPLPQLQIPNSFSSFPTIPGLLNLNNQAMSTPIILNFGNTNSPQVIPQRAANEEAGVACEPMNKFGDGDEPSKQAMKKSGGRVKAQSQTYDHIIAERKRREQLSQRFVALSTIVPGLKKTDKTSVLGDAIKYLKYLQDRVKILEEQATNKTMESVVLVRKSQANLEDADDTFEDKSPSPPDEQPLPEIEARVCNNQILIRVHCENQKGLLANLIDRVEKLNLTITNTNVSSFGRLALDVTIITEMEKEFNLTVNEVVKRTRAALQDTL